MSSHKSVKQELRAISAGHIKSKQREGCARCQLSTMTDGGRLYCERNRMQVNKLDICTFFKQASGTAIKRIVTVAEEHER